LRSEAKHLGVTFPQHATQFVVEGVSHLVSRDSSRKFLLNVIAKLQELEALNGSDIQAKFNDCPYIVPLDILFQCEKLGVISLVLYFQSCVDHSKKATALLRLLVDAACESKNEENEVLRYFLDMFVQLGHNDLPTEMKNTVSNKTINAASVILKNISRKIWDFLWENPEKHVYFLEISDVKGFAQIKLPSYQKCYLELLAYLLSYKPDVKPATAITSQSEWTYFKNPKNVLHLITQVCLIAFHSKDGDNMFTFTVARAFRCPGCCRED
jgi:Fanconi anaemia group A protein N terminus